MGRIIIVCLVAAMLLVACGSEPYRPLPDGARVSADRFVRALIVKRDLKTATRYASDPTATSLPIVRRSFDGSGTRRVVQYGKIRKHCSAHPLFGTGEKGQDCIAYVLVGVCIGGDPARFVITRESFRVWMVREHDSWKVNAYDSNAVITLKGRPKPNDLRRLGKCSERPVE